MSNSNDPASPRAEDEQCINIDDEAEVARWTHRLCTSKEILRQAVAAVGPRVGEIKRYVFVGHVKAAARRKGE